MTNIEEKSEIEWVQTQIESIARNRAINLIGQTTNEYEIVINQYGFSPREAIDFLKDKYEVRK
jgi:hypothetical protein